jgi:two-component system phosphate regulon sensor histidine kinase PhoR
MAEIAPVMISRKMLLRALVSTFVALVPFPEWENQLYDQKLMLIRRVAPIPVTDTVILDLSKSDFEALKAKFYKSHNFDRFEEIRNQFLWNDAVYENALYRILSENPAALMVTQFVGESLVNLQDWPSLQKLVRDPRVIWASQFDADNKLIKPAPQLTGRENYGFLNVTPDSDGVVRRFLLVNANHASLPFRALANEYEKMREYTPLTKPQLIAYAGTQGTVPSCRLQDLFEKSGACPSLTGKYVFLAPNPATVAGGNLYHSPVGALSRAEVLANILLTAKNRAHFVPVTPWLLFLLILIQVYGFGYMILNRPPEQQLLYAAVVLLSDAVLVTAALPLLRLQIPFLPFFVGLVASYFMFLWMKSGQEETRRWEAEKRAQYLRELDELKSNFLSLMSHDLKTPIAKVQALTERLSREAAMLGPAQKDILHAISRSNDELAQYIVSILNFQKIESQELSLNLKSNDINVLIDETVERLLPLAEEKNIALEKELEPMFAAEFDEQLIRQVLANLVDNAIKYNPNGTRVRIRSADDGDFLTVSVEDNGMGIDAETQKRLFQKFSRSEKGTAERVKGTGLGLYLSKYFIELHGGTIEVESAPGAGTKFRFRLPVKS